MRARTLRPRHAAPLVAALALLLAGCRGVELRADGPDPAAAPVSPRGPVRVAHLPFGAPAAADLAELRAAFAAANPGYDLAWLPATTALPAGEGTRVAFVQGGAGTAGVQGPAGILATDVAVGDVILLRPEQALSANAPLDLLVFTTPERLPADLPAVVRPDYDPRITDTPGGCAEGDQAYRRILLTWLPSVGPYVYHALNAHRVRIVDSFTHYHPLAGGFDELYLVQEAPAGARVLTSERTAAILRPETVDAATARALLDTRPLAVGDLVYLPRGVVHRGLGGAVVQVITVPGFRPGQEIGVDHDLRAIAERLGLGPDALPYHAEAADRAVVK